MTMMDVLSLPLELLDYIGKYLGDVDRSAAARACRRFRSGFSYVESSRVLPSGRIILDCHMKFLDEFRARIESLRRKEAREILDVSCRIERDVDPLLIILLMCKIASPIVILGNELTLGSIEHIHRLCGLEDRIRIKRGNEGNNLRRDLIENMEENMVILLSYKIFEKVPDAYEHKVLMPNICLISRDFMEKKSMRWATDDCYHLGGSGSILLRLSVRIAEGTSDLFPHTISLYLEGKEHVYEDFQAIRKKDTDLSISYVHKDPNFISRYDGVYQDQALMASQAYSSFKTFRKEWRMKKKITMELIIEHIHNHIMYLFSRYGNIPILYMYDTFFPKLWDPSKLPDMVHMLVKYIEVHHGCDSVEYTDVAECSTSDVDLGISSAFNNMVKLMKDERPHFTILALRKYSTAHTRPVIPPLKARKYIMIVEYDINYDREQRCVDVLNDRGERIISGDSECFIINIKLLPRGLDHFGPHYAPDEIIGASRRAAIYRKVREEIASRRKKRYSESHRVGAHGPNAMTITPASRL